MEKLVGRISCKDDNGNPYIVEEWEERIHAGHMQNPHATIPGMRRIVLADGGSVRQIDDQTFEIFGTGVLIRRG